MKLEQFILNVIIRSLKIVVKLFALIVFAVSLGFILYYPELTKEVIGGLVYWNISVITLYFIVKYIEHKNVIKIVKTIFIMAIVYLLVIIVL